MTWVRSKTMPEWEHEYIVRCAENDVEFIFLVNHIRSNGYVGKFWAKDITYFECAGLVYWTMGCPLYNEDGSWCTIIINRTQIENSFDYRKKHGTLPAYTPKKKKPEDTQLKLF